MLLSWFAPTKSPFLYVQYRPPGQVKKRYVKTAIRKEDPDHARKIALEINRLQRTLLLSGNGAAAGVESNEGAGWFWVPGWLRTRYASRSRTRAVYEAQWERLVEFLVEAQIDGPALLERADCFNYLDFRTAQVKEKSGRNVRINTAIGELKLLGMAMDEAVARGHAMSNPARKLKIEREDTAIKPEISEDEEEKILAALATQPDWMQLSFEIAIATGLRFSDTRLASGSIQWSNDLIEIAKPKGGHKRAFSIPIYDSIRNVLRVFHQSKRPFLWTMPEKDRGLNGILWMRFFRELGLDHLCFHCTRVTFISRGMRAGIPESVMMKMVNHGLSLINRIYQRWTSDDVRRYAALIPGRSSGAATKQNPREKLSRKSAGAPRVSTGEEPRSSGETPQPAP